MESLADYPHSRCWWVPNSTSTRGHPRTRRKNVLVCARQALCLHSVSWGRYYYYWFWFRDGKKQKHNPEASWDAVLCSCPAGHRGKTCSEQDLLTPKPALVSANSALPWLMIAAQEPPMQATEKTSLGPKCAYVSWVQTKNSLVL